MLGRGFVRRCIIRVKLRKLTTQLRAKERLTMRATGIVRRIDELGRVVIPKEIRRTLRIREGDSLEIFTDHDGEVIGALLLLSHDTGARMTEIDLKVAETTAGLVGRQMEQ